MEYRYTIADKTWTLDYEALTLDDWAAAERATGQHWAQIALAMDTRSALGLKVGLWLARRRESPALGYNDPELTIRPRDMRFEVFAAEEDQKREGEQRVTPRGNSSGSPTPA